MNCDVAFQVLSGSKLFLIHTRCHLCSELTHMNRLTRASECGEYWWSTSAALGNSLTPNGQSRDPCSNRIKHNNSKFKCGLFFVCISFLLYVWHSCPRISTNLWLWEPLLGHKAALKVFFSTQMWSAGVENPITFSKSIYCRNVPLLNTESFSR